ncbi:hypothetical protein ASD65_17230 [Microbacterium sp. Root61]|uniref:UDP-N-acetylglucosamine 2-epimerase n=1 Tax=Microbacterium sp. Root61 TaxID=1736570 RepID=UPI0006FC3478|nr:UDP-N-acetylglucosamine 2-epimerase [Microbacterium sp. Root61]KRA22244.1 hypothetical protein ASD65_17230 [Microbacterium sp. Root61]
MIIFVYGTTAEAIKIAPIARRLQDRGIRFQQWITQQHTDALRRALPELGLPEPDRVIANGWRGNPLKTPLQMLGWMFDVAGWTLRNMRPARRALPTPRVVVVHGDTVTTVLGTFIGRLYGCTVAHVEAGLRSGDWRHPFPEELDRRIVGRLAHVHYAPSLEAVENLAGRSNVVFTHGNTVRDAVRDTAGGDSGIIGEEYGLILLHRYEFISEPALVQETLQRLEESSPLPMRVVVDSYSRDAITQTIAELGLTRFSIVPKVEHAEFVRLLRAASFVVTDSGGIQEESAEFGIPTLIHRMATERSEGIGSSAVLSRWDGVVVENFLRTYGTLRAETGSDENSPSEIIVADLIERGFAAEG